MSDYFTIGQKMHRKATEASDYNVAAESLWSSAAEILIDDDWVAWVAGWNAAAAKWHATNAL